MSKAEYKKEVLGISSNYTTDTTIQLLENIKFYYIDH